MIETDRLLGALKERYGYERFRPRQREAVEHVLSGGDALVLMPTGGGKSLCYQLPAMLSDGLTIIVSPLIALMRDQVRTLRRIGAQARYLNSTLSAMETADVERSVVDGAAGMLYVAPERVNTKRFRELLERRAPSLIAIDEAHCISEWGHEFRPDYRALRRLTERFVDVPTVACTATATPQVQRDIVEQLDRPRMRTFATNFMRDNLTLRIVAKRKAKERLIARLSQMPGQAAIVYGQTRKTTELFAEQLRQSGIAAEHYHAGMDSDERHAVQDRFLSGATPVICATIAFGMGIDKPDIRLVAHLDMPPSIESYYQEIGRAGRDGEPSECLMFFTKGVWHQQLFFIKQLQDDTERQRRIDRLRTMMQFCEQQRCRWQRILSYFGDQRPSNACGHCDNCLGDTADEYAADVSKPARRRVVDPDDPPPAPGNGTLASLSAEEAELYEALRQWRTAAAADAACDPSALLSPSAMRQIAQTPPSTRDALSGIEGVGALAIERHADQLLELLGVRPARAVEASPSTASTDVPSWQISVDCYLEGHTVLAIAERRMLSPSTIASHLKTAIRQGQAIDLQRSLPPADMVRAVEHLLDETPDASVSDLHERLGYRLSRTELSIVVDYLRPPEPA